MISTIKKDLKELIKWFREYIFAKRHALKLKLAIKLANMKQRAMNKQYFVILSQSDQLISVNNREIERLKRLPRYTTKQLKHIIRVLHEEEEDALARMKADGLSKEDIRKIMYDIKLVRERTIIRMKKMKLLPKDLDGLRLRKLAFYYTTLKWNNDPSLTPAQRKEAKERYLHYAKRYLR